LKTFTVYAWTSIDLNIANQCDLVFKLRSDDKVISRVEAKKVWHDILKSTLKAKDLKNLDDNDGVDP